MKRIKREFELKNEFLRRPHDPAGNRPKPVFPVDPVPSAAETEAQKPALDIGPQPGKGRLLDDGVLKSKSVCLSGEQLIGNDRVVEQRATDLMNLVRIPIASKFGLA